MLAPSFCQSVEPDRNVDLDGDVARPVVEEGDLAHRLAARRWPTVRHATGAPSLPRGVAPCVVLQMKTTPPEGAMRCQSSLKRHSLAIWRRENQPWIKRQPWYVKALVYGFVAGWFAACTFLIGIVVIAAVS